MATHSLTVEDADRLLEQRVCFPEHDAVFERVRPITDFRRDGGEARILYICERKPDPSWQLDGQNDGNALYVLKCKIQ